MNRTDITLTWPHRLALLLGGRLVITWVRGATGPTIARIDVEVGKRKEAEA